MFTCKKGDKVRALVDWCDIKAGDILTVDKVAKFGVWAPDRDGVLNYMTYKEIEPVQPEPEWVPKVGDRVRYDSGNDHFQFNTVGKVYEVLAIKTAPDEFVVSDNFGNTNHHWSASEFYKRFSPATLTIQAGRYYKTRDGRKVGPMYRVSDFWSAGSGASGTPGHFTDNGVSAFLGLLPRESSRAEHDLIAEWVDEPAAQPAATAEAAAPKFKVGDRVYTIDDENDFGTITRAEKGKFAIQWDARPQAEQSLLWNDYEMVHVVAPTAPTTPRHRRPDRERQAAPVGDTQGARLARSGKRRGQPARRSAQGPEVRRVRPRRHQGSRQAGLRA